MVEVGDKIADLKIKVGAVVGICPQCGDKLVVKEGKYGKFVGCKGFRTRRCSNTYKYETFRLLSYEIIEKINNKERKNKLIKIIENSDLDYTSKSEICHEIYDNEIINEYELKEVIQYYRKYKKRERTVYGSFYSGTVWPDNSHYLGD